MSEISVRQDTYWYRLETSDTKKTSFFISYKWYQPDGSIPKIPYQPIL
jgi:hypothetical protein